MKTMTMKDIKTFAESHNVTTLDIIQLHHAQSLMESRMIKNTDQLLTVLKVWNEKNQEIKSLTLKGNPEGQSLTSRMPFTINIY